MIKKFSHAGKIYYSFLLDVTTCYKILYLNRNRAVFQVFDKTARKLHPTSQFPRTAFALTSCYPIQIKRQQRYMKTPDKFHFISS